MSEYYFDPELRRRIESLLLPDIQMPGQYIGGEQGSVVKRADSVRGRLCFAFPDLYTIGMSHYGLQLLYAVINRREDWSCERVFTPGVDMERLLRDNGLPLYSLESFTPLDRFDALAFTLQYELCYTNVLTMLDLGRIPIRSENRRQEHPLVIAGGPTVFNPEPMSDFIDLFIIGDGEESLPAVCDAWLEMKQANLSREESLLEIGKRFPYVYVPQFYHVDFNDKGHPGRPKPFHTKLPERITPAIVSDIDAFDPPEYPIVPLIESVQDRIAVEIMRGCPGACRFCQSTVQKAPIRIRNVESIVKAAKTACENSGVRDVSLLSLSSSDYPHFEELMRQIGETLTPLGISVTVPSLRVNHQLSGVMQSLTTERTSGITIAPEAARDEMRKRILKQVTHENLIEGCRSAFENGFSRVKMYFMCGLPCETEDDINGIIELSEEIAFLGKSVMKRFPAIVASVSNFIPKPQTPLQWLGMQRQEYFSAVHERLRTAKHLRCVQVKYHGLKTSLMEGVFSRGDRRLGQVIETAWRNGARLDAWREHFQNDLWLGAAEQCGVDIDPILHEPYAISDELPWSHIGTCRPVRPPKWMAES